jgi:hypothetical protein
MELMVIENVPEKALQFEECGVDRIFIDLEILGKDERQGHLNTVISRHTIDDIRAVKKVLTKAKLLVRVNPINPESEQEIKGVISSGADVLMLPMFTTQSEVEAFIKFVDKKAKVNLLLETPQAAIRIDEILSVPGIDEIHIGLNDLHLAFGLNMMMEMYLGGFLENLSKKIKFAKISLGIGGIAPLDGGIINGKLVAAEATRLGCERFILSRAFPKDDPALFKKNVKELKQYCAEVEKWPNHKKIENLMLLKNSILKNRVVPK